jgi:ABC-type transport system involved in multi-copper enzyme maturation permease subunit
MRTVVRQFATLTWMTAAEAIRQPLYTLLTLGAVTFTVLLPMFALFPGGDISRLARDGGLAFQLVAGLLLCGFTSANALRGELLSGSAAMILCKPVSRDTFFLAKFAGTALVLLLFSCSVALATLVSQRVCSTFSLIYGRYDDIRLALVTLAAVPLAAMLGAIRNYFRGAPFGSTTSLSLPLLMLALILPVARFAPEGDTMLTIQEMLPWATLKASLLIMAALGVLSATALTLTVKLPTPATVGVLALLGSLGLLSEHLIPPNQEHLVALLARALLPNWQQFWIADQLTHNSLSALHLGAAILYALLYTTAVLLVGSAWFRHTDIETANR